MQMNCQLFVGNKSVGMATGDDGAAVIQLNGNGLYLNYRQLQSLPRQLFSPNVSTVLGRLYLKNNLLSSLPAEIKLLQNLTELYVGSNSLKSLPEELGELSQLESLGVSDNQLTEIPLFVCHLRNLKRLQLSRNQLTHLPSEIGELTQLETLEMSHNRLRNIPPELGCCLHLRQLSLDSNQLTVIPRQLCSLPMLTEISASDNHLTSLPQDLGRMSSFQTVYVDNNPFLTAVPVSTLNKSVGFCGSGKGTIPEGVLNSHQYIILENSEEGNVIVLLPPQITSLCHFTQKCIPSLLEMTLRVVSKAVSLGLNVQKEDLPSDMISLLHAPTAHCQNCSQEVFVAAFPIVFRAQVRTNNLVLLGLCCSAACVRQCSLTVHLPLLYPRLEDLAWALVLPLAV